MPEDPIEYSTSLLEEVLENDCVPDERPVIGQWGTISLEGDGTTHLFNQTDKNPAKSAFRDIGWWA